MPTTKIRVDVDADGAGFHRTMGGIETRVKSFGSSLKGHLATAFGALGIGMMVHNISAFVDEIQNAADRLDLTTTKVQELRVAARHAGKDLSFFDKVFQNQDKVLGMAAGGDSSALSIAKALGLNDTDIKKTVGKDVILKKALESVSGMNPQNAVARLSEMYGHKSAGALYAMKDDILNSNATILNPDSISRLDELMDSFEDLRDTILIGLIPALEALITYVENAVGTWSTGKRSMDEMDSEAAAIWYDKHGKNLNEAGYRQAKSWQFIQDSAYNTGVAALTVDPLHNGAEKEKILTDIRNGTLKRKYGDDVFDELMKTYKPSENVNVFKQLEQTRARRVEARELKEKLSGMLVDREAIGVAKETPRVTNLEGLGSNQFLRVGNALGIDARYRIERLTIQANNYLLRTANAVESIDKKLSSGPSQEYPA